MGDRTAVPATVSPACEFSAPKRRITEQLPNDRQVGDYRFVRRISTDKRACVYEYSVNSRVVGKPEVIVPSDLQDYFRARDLTAIVRILGQSLRLSEVRRSGEP